MNEATLQKEQLDLLGMVVPHFNAVGLEEARHYLRTENRWQIKQALQRGFVLPGAIPLPAMPAPTVDSQIVFWTGFYAVVFEMDTKADLLKLNWPEPNADFWDIPMVKGLSETRVFHLLKCWNKFPAGSYYNDLDMNVKENDRHPSRGTYGVRFHADPEGDEDQKNISAARHMEIGTKGNTLLEAEVLEPMYFIKSGGRHLNQATVNHAIGSRFSDDNAPTASWDDWFYISLGSPPGCASPNLCARVAVVTF